MCGIVGIVGATGARERALAMNARIVHRGPDDEGCWADGDSALAVRRLSIIDLAGGHQPMIAPSRTVLAFNGEIYNFRTLRRELEGRWNFHTRSDTEVVLALYETDGIGALDRLEGMFAFALLDRPRGKMHLVRDRLGKKPLYYTNGPGPLLFASELKALLAGLDTRPPLDRQALHDYLTLRYVPAPATPWEGIRKLEPGERLEIDLDSGLRQLHRWWRLSVVSTTAAEPDAPGRFEGLLLEAVEKRLVASDVPVGVLLSGGIDSSAVSAAAVELGHRDFHTFSVGFDEGGEFSELSFAREVAEHIGSQHHEVVIDRDTFIAALPELVYQTDEPLADLATVPLHAVAKLAHEHVKVVLSGEGADEVLAGYDLDTLAARLHRLHPLSHVPRQLLRLAAVPLPPGRGDMIRHLASSGWSGVLGGQPMHMTWIFDEHEKAELWRGATNFRSTGTLVHGWYDEARSPDPLDRLIEVYCRSWLPEDLLMKADKATMAASVELRTPFLDHHLVEWAAEAPLEWKVGSAQVGWSSKRILREFAATRLPRSILERPKRGFPVPAYAWLADGFGDWASQRLLRRDSRLAELLEPNAIKVALECSARGDVHAAHQVWSLLVLDYWLDCWT